jgi:hypothetical protein
MEPISRCKWPEYRVYRQMLDRCYLKTAPNYKYYGAKGVRVCSQWRFGDGTRGSGFRAFIADMGRRPEGLTLDRIDPNLDYEPGNCRWAPWSVQHKNRREHHMSVFERAALRKKRSEAKRGSRSPTARLNEAQVRIIKRMIAEGARTSHLAKMFDVAPQTICGIKRGDKWVHVTIPEAA